MPGKAKATITRKVTPLRKELEKDLLAAAKERKCTTGKWMLFPTVEDVDYVWGKVAKGTAERELGVAAKVAAGEDGGEGDGWARRLICVYTKDFADAEDVKRVLLGLKETGLLRGDDGGEGRGIYYKCGEWTCFVVASSYRLEFEKYLLMELQTHLRISASTLGMSGASRPACSLRRTYLAVSRKSRLRCCESCKLGIWGSTYGFVLFHSYIPNLHINHLF